MTGVIDREAHAENPSATATDRPIGYGRMQRKEDPRFIRGKGHYLDDVVLPGMLHGAILRSPLAHARIVSIDTTEALAHPKVHAVITGKDLEGLEGAFGAAEAGSPPGEALELIDVEYEDLPVVIDARRALDPGTAVIRD